MFFLLLSSLLASANAQNATASSPTMTVDSARFVSSAEVRHLTNKICGDGGLRLPGSQEYLEVVDFIECQLDGIPGITTTISDFELDDWSPSGNSMYQAARFKIGDKKVDVVGAMAYTPPTNGSYVSGQLTYLFPRANISAIDLKGKIIVRDYRLLAVPEQLITGTSYHVSSDVPANGPYTRPFVTPPHLDLLACSLRGATGYISAFNVSHDQLEGYYTSHSGTHWLVSGIFTGAEEYQELLQAAQSHQTASIRIDATTDTVKVPRLHATLPGQSNETIVLETRTDGDTYVQENGPAALLTLARYFASLPLSSRPKTLKFAFEASHLAYQKDFDKLLAIALDENYDNANDTTAFVIAIEHLGTREIEQIPAPDGKYGNVLNYTGRGESILWSVGPVQKAIDSVINIATARNLDNTIVAPGFPPANADAVPEYFSMGGLGTLLS